MYSTIIGLEIHAELCTKSKMFCQCKVPSITDTPNTVICATCTGHPGTLPLPNKEAVRMVATLCTALHCTIREVSKFDRKHYFYPDLPKGYQISQYDEPIAEHGSLTLHFGPGENIRDTATISIRRVHLEEDTARLSHIGQNSFVDFNRSGVPLAEIVSGADIASALEAKTYCQELQRILRALHISEADMEKGHMRCEANISVQIAGTYELRDGNVHPLNGTTLNAKVEVKNINSFRALEKAILYEIQRQTNLLDNGKTWQSETRGWNEDEEKTIPQRSKENAADYRYFPEPDIPPFHPRALLDGVHIPELPQAKRQRFMDEYSFSFADALFLTEDANWASFTERAMSELLAWQKTTSAPTPKDISDIHIGKLAAGWMTSKLQGMLVAQQKTIQDISFSAENFAEFIMLLATKKINSTNAQKLLLDMISSQSDLSPTRIMEEKGYGQLSDSTALSAIIDTVLAAHPDQVAAYKSGKTPLLQFLKGMVIKASGGTADPQETEQLLKEKMG